MAFKIFTPKSGTTSFGLPFIRLQKSNGKIIFTKPAVTALNLQVGEVIQFIHDERDFTDWAIVVYPKGTAIKAGMFQIASEYYAIACKDFVVQFFKHLALIGENYKFILSRDVASEFDTNMGFPDGTRVHRIISNSQVEVRRNKNG